MRRIALRGTPIVVGEALELPVDAAHYAVHVLRLPRGTVVELFDGAGHRFHATLESLEPATVSVFEELPDNAESTCRITLYQALAKGDRFELVVEKCTELGVAAIVPVETARTVVKVPANKRESKRDRWQRIADSAARQSGRTVVPEIGLPRSLREAMGAAPHEVELVLDPRGAVSLPHALSSEAHDVAIWIGPEGGFTEEELGALRSRAKPIGLGPRILRSETAGITATALVQFQTGGLD